MLNSLNVAQTGLTAAKIAVENVSNNIANENTPGYKKRIVQLSELSLVDSRFTGSGVSADEAYRVTSEYLFNNIMRENTKNNYYEEISSIVGNVEQMFQETDTSGFSNDLNRFFQAVENLRSTPSSELFKTTLKTTGSSLVDSMQNLYENLEQQEELTYNNLEDNVKQINSILHDIGALNEQMGQEYVASNDLLDKRDQLEKELSSLVDIEVDRSEGDYQLKIGGAVAVRYNTNIREVNLVEETVAQVDRFATSDANGNAINSIGYDETTGTYGTLASGDTITYKFDNTHEVSVTIGDTYINTDENPPVSISITEDNYVRALAYEINHNTYISERVDAFNGNYQVDADGNKIDSTTADKFLVIEAKTEGTEGSFSGRITITTAADGSDTVFKDDYQSVEASNKVFLAVYDEEISVNSGAVKAQLENLDTTSPNNMIEDYKNKLDALAATLSDIYGKYVVENGDDYTFGHISTDLYNGDETVNSLNLFSGSSVKTLVFNEDMVNDLSQEDLDYISEMQWKDDIDFDGFAQDGSTSNKTSFSEFFQELRVSISSDKENNDFLMETQTAVVQSLETTYEDLTKVNSDEEMVNLIQFQAAYTANAKIITVIDEMLQTLLGIR